MGSRSHSTGCSISPDEFILAYPKLFHVSLARDLGKILHHGLLSTTALLDLCEYEGESRSPIESRRRTNAVSISHPVHGEFLINDQAPMSESALRRCLIDLIPREWYESLSRRFFSGRRIRDWRSISPLALAEGGSGWCLVSIHVLSSMFLMTICSNSRPSTPGTQCAKPRGEVRKPS